MIYFINFGMPDYKSGIEHAEIKRLNLFKKHKQPAKIIVRDWNATLHKTANEAGVDDNDLLGMFDYFQDAIKVQSKTIYLSDINFGLDNLNYTFEKEHQRYLVTDINNKLVGRVNINNEIIKSVEFFDEYGNLYCVDWYDTRGFKSLRQWYTPDGKIGNEEWLTPNGKVVLRTFNKFNMQGKLVKTGWFLQEKDNHVHTFDTIDNLFEYFLNKINEKGNNIFILDRSLLADAALTRLKRPAYTVMHLHNSQSSDAQKPLNSILNNNYEYALNNIDKYDAIVSATKRQTNDVIERFHPKAHMFTIPVGIVKDENLNENHIPMDKRIYGKIISVARIAYEKHLDDLVRAVGIVHEQIPEATLDLYGYADSSNNYAEKHKVEKVIKDLHLENVVTFKGYTNDIAEIEKKAQIFGVTSRMEGFHLAIQEALSHGMIGVTYDVNYGPNDIVVNDKNGYVVPYGDYEALAQDIIKTLKNKALMQQLSDGAYKTSNRYSENNVWTKWKQLIDDAETKLEGRI